MVTKKLLLTIREMASRGFPGSAEITTNKHVACRVHPTIAHNLICLGWAVRQEGSSLIVLTDRGRSEAEHATRMSEMQD